ncbi:MAG: tripartite tricarboxylate transporter substrate binding protein [Oxalobacteraceae bacterium]|nr:MAG: tripartite tricarboxylate transporter substrate binding protein [Oxalobacteraceae bacterium]
MRNVLCGFGRNLVTIALVTTCHWAWADSYPSKPVQIIVPYAAGGPVDLTARSLATQLQTAMNQPFLVVNQPGGSGNIGASVVAKAAPDGYTLLLTADTALTANVALFGSRMGFDPARDLRPVVTVLSYGQMLAVHPSVPARTLKEFVALAKQESFTYASAGNGAPGHLAMEQFIGLTGIKAVHIPYKGTSQAVNDLLGGQVQSGFMITPGVIQHVRAGKLVPLAVSSSKRSVLAPDIPTVKEAGLPAATTESTFVLMAPSGTPGSLVMLLNSQVRAALASDAVKAFMQHLDLSPVGDSPEEAERRLAATTTQLVKLVKERNIRAD